MTKATKLVIIEVLEKPPLRFSELGFRAGSEIEISHQNFFLNTMMVTLKGAKYYTRISDFNRFYKTKRNNEHTKY